MSCLARPLVCVTIDGCNARSHESDASLFKSGARSSVCSIRSKTAARPLCSLNAANRPAPVLRVLRPYAALYRGVREADFTTRLYYPWPRMGVLTGFADSSVRALRSQACTAFGGVSRFRSTSMVCLLSPDGFTDPALDAHLLPIMAWARAVWLGRIPLSDLQLVLDSAA